LNLATAVRRRVRPRVGSKSERKAVYNSIFARCNAFINPLEKRFRKNCAKKFPNARYFPKKSKKSAATGRFVVNY